MLEFFEKIDFECPKCHHTDKAVLIPEEEYREIEYAGGGHIEHICSKCGCLFNLEV